jgi:SAM-dependent methyltransferase
MKRSSIKNWKRFGKQDPYYGVLSEAKYKSQNITAQGLQEFFASGESFVRDAEAKIFRQFGMSLTDSSILDFGCGVGRLVIPFALLSHKRVVGLDVSADIIEKAKIHSQALNLPHLKLLSFDGVTIPALPKFDFINSYIVFQHIEPRLGFSLLRQLLELLNEGGVMQVQITYGHRLPTLTYWNFFLRGKFAPYNYLYSSVKNRKPGSEPVMQMNHYPPQKLFDLFSKYSLSVEVEFTDHFGHLGAFYRMKKDKK